MPFGSLHGVDQTARGRRRGRAGSAKLYQSDNPRYRARALWLLSKIEGHAAKHIETALKRFEFRYPHYGIAGRARIGQRRVAVMSPSW